MHLLGFLSISVYPSIEFILGLQIGAEVNHTKLYGWIYERARADRLHSQRNMVYNFHPNIGTGSKHGHKYPFRA